MKILSYNLRSGAIDTYQDLVALITTEKPDVLCLQEANGWHLGTPSRLQQFAEATGFHAWQFGDSNTDFKLVTYSRLPIVAGESLTEGFWHSAVRITVSWENTPLTIWNIHLDPRAPSYRVAEITQLISLADTSERVVVTGDLNSVSQSDTYPPDLLKKLLLSGIEKFGTTNLSFDELDLFANAGLIDTFARRKVTENTVPTPANNDLFHAAHLRLDYLLASPSIDSLITNVTVIKNSRTDRISDHYPLRALLKQ